MNIIFLDMDGVIDTVYYHTYEQMAGKIKILIDICNTYNAKVVIEAASKSAIDETTLEVDPNALFVNFIVSLLKKYNLFYGRTPDVGKYLEDRYHLYEMWKEDEIRLYLMRHPEVDHYCVIDDDDLNAMYKHSDLDKVRPHLVCPTYYDQENPENEGLQPYHKEEVGKALKLENEIKKYALRSKYNK